MKELLNNYKPGQYVIFILDGEERAAHIIDCDHNSKILLIEYGGNYYERLVDDVQLYNKGSTKKKQ